MSEQPAAYRAERIGYCEGLCGGLLSHHLVGGLCPACRRDPRIRDSRPAPAQRRPARREEAA